MKCAQEADDVDDDDDDEEAGVSKVREAISASCLSDTPLSVCNSFHPSLPP